MLKLKSVVKSREQLLATGWVVNSAGNYIYKEGKPFLGSFVNSEMIGRKYNGVIKSLMTACKLEGIDDTWILYPEMMLVTDQWGFVRDPETFEILMWDVVRFDKAVFVNGIDKLDEYFPIMRLIGGEQTCTYTKDGELSPDFSPTLSKYPYSLTHGGYTPFDFEELKEAFNCPKVVEGNDDTPIVNGDTPETVTTYEQDGYKYTVSRVKI